MCAIAGKGVIVGGKLRIPAAIHLYVAGTTQHVQVTLVLPAGQACRHQTQLQIAAV